ncbi:MAG: thioredoxin domain-containing protein [Deltaproteobacteria bacterium]
MSVALTQKTFDRTIATGIVVIDWWAAWCGPCRAFAPVFEAASQRHPTVTFGKVDTDGETQLAARFEISAIPTLMVFRDGVLVFRRAGAIGVDGLDVLIDHVKALPSSEVRGAR